MVTNLLRGYECRKGIQKARSPTYNFKMQKWVKCDSITRRFVDGRKMVLRSKENEKKK